MFQEVCHLYTVSSEDHWVTSFHLLQPQIHFPSQTSSAVEDYLWTFLLAVKLTASTNMCFLGGISLVFVSLEQWISQSLKPKKDLKKMEHKTR